MKTVKAIGFDADDTLWEIENYYQDTTAQFIGLVADYAAPEEAGAEFFKTEMQNLQLYGFGAKSFILSMLETAYRLGGQNLPPRIPRQILELGKQLIALNPPLIAGVQPTLQALSPRFTLAVITKGDLLDQERKLKNSGIEKYFSHVEIVSDKTETSYQTLLAKIGVKPEEFLMVGNSVKSDILPALNIGCYAAHVPFHVTWQHEVSDMPPEGEKFVQLTSIADLPRLLN